MFISIFKTILSVFLSVLCFFTSPVFGKFAEPIQPKDAENVRMTFAAISDIHMTDSALRQGMLELGLYDMANAERRLDAYLMLGDNTDHGEPEQYDQLIAAMSKYDIADTVLLAEGNHDTWTTDESGADDTAAAQQNFIDFNKTAAGREIDKVYYSTEVNGYPFIFLGSEGSGVAAYISDEQLSWLRAEMDAAAATGKPIFVISHWPFKGTHGLPKTFGEADYDEWTGSLGEQNDAVEAIVKDYDNVFYMSGHNHAGFANDNAEKIYGYNSFETEGSLHRINLPSFMYMSIFGRISNGTGFVVEVYDDEVVFRARSFSAGVWYTFNEASFPLV
ncbi:MAG: metallophosphoesterase [Clostridia bacterium]|nr:metallophosphoesterase [Clostridia bacterium]